MLVVAFALWCALKLRTELAAISLVPVWRSWHLLLCAALLSLANYVLRALRWRWYLVRLGHSLSFGYALLTYCAGFAFTLSPGKVGEVARARYYTGVPLRHTTAAFCLERCMDVAAVSALALCAVPSLWLHPRAFGVGTAAFTLVARVRRSVTDTLQEARDLMRPGALAIALGIGVLAWGLEGLGLYVLGLMFPTAHLGLPVMVGIYAVAVLAGAAAMLPGGLGGTEVAMTALLVSQGLAAADAVLLTVACRVVTLWFAVVLGWAAILALRWRRSAAEVIVGSN